MELSSLTYRRYPGDSTRNELLGTQWVSENRRVGGYQKTTHSSFFKKSSYVEPMKETCPKRQGEDLIDSGWEGKYQRPLGRCDKA